MRKSWAAGVCAGTLLRAVGITEDARRFRSRASTRRLAASSGCLAPGDIPAICRGAAHVLAQSSRYLAHADSVRLGVSVFAKDVSPGKAHPIASIWRRAV